MSVARLKLEGRLNFQHLCYHGSIMLENEAAKETTKKKIYEFPLATSVRQKKKFLVHTWNRT